VRRAAAVAALVVLALLVALLLRPGSRDATSDEREAEQGTRDKVSTEETQAGTRPAKAPLPRPAGLHVGEGEPSEEAVQPPVEPPRVAGICVLEDGTPLPGVEFHTSLGGNLEEEGASAADGTLSLIKDAPSIIIGPRSDPVSVEGGTSVQDAHGDWRVTPTTPGFRITFRDRPHWAHVRLVDADAVKPVIDVTGLKVIWHIPGGTMTLGFDESQAPGGWVPLPEARLPETPSGGRKPIEVEPEKVEVEFAMPGFERTRLPLGEVRGRREIRVRPVPAEATGEIRAPGISEKSRGLVTSTLRWTGPEPAPSTASVLGLPNHPGAFSLYDLPDGPWVLEVAATLPGNTVVRGKKAFEKRGGPVDLGTIELVPAGRVTIGVLDAAGDPIPQAWAVIVRPEEDPAQGRRLDFDDWGVVALGDLEPGVGHRVIAKGLPRELEQTIVASADNKPVEFKWPEKLVPCRITISVDGKAVANADGRTSIPAVVQESPLPRNKGKWSADGTFEAKLVPGTYRFSVLATPKEGGDLALFGGEVTVPSGDSFETKLELKREGR
jgi:hypothetical protein